MAEKNGKLGARLSEIRAVNKHFSDLFSHVYYGVTGLNSVKRASEEEVEIIANIREVLNKAELTETALVVATKAAALAAIAEMLDVLSYDLAEANELARKTRQIALKIARRLKRATE